MCSCRDVVQYIYSYIRSSCNKMKNASVIKT